MQVMSWMMSRLGSRFSLFFEPAKRQVMHSAMGMFYGQSLDLEIGLIEPDGTRRVLPFTQHGKLLSNIEQFERMNSITFRGYSEAHRVRFELNVHSIFYPQYEVLSTIPVFFIEMRLNPVKQIRWEEATELPTEMDLFFILRRPKTEITSHNVDPEVLESGDLNPLDHSHLNLNYDVNLKAKVNRPERFGPIPDSGRTIAIQERILSLTPEAEVISEADLAQFHDCPAGTGCGGMTMRLPVSHVGSGIKWRLLWGAYCKDPILDVKNPDIETEPETEASHGPKAENIRYARFKYASRYDNLDDVITDAATNRDDYLAYSRRYEKIFDQTSLHMGQRHLMHLSFQTFLSNTFWCVFLPVDQPGPLGEAARAAAAESTGINEDESALDHVIGEWFTAMEGANLYQSTLDVEYNVSVFYLAVWPQLLKMQLTQWPMQSRVHEPSNGRTMRHDLGQGTLALESAFYHEMEVEENCNYLLLMQAYAHWTGDTSLVNQYAQLVKELARYLLWTDRDSSGFPSEGTANTLADAGAELHVARKQTYLAVKRLGALRAAGDLLRHTKTFKTCGDSDHFIADIEEVVESAANKIEHAAWLGDHYAVCVDKTTAGLYDKNTGELLPPDEMPGWDDYSIYSANGLLLPTMISQPCPMDTDRLILDLSNARRETMGRYGCSHRAQEPDNVWVSQNIWRDHLARYMGIEHIPLAQRYWDLQVVSNTFEQSYAYNDCYISNNLSFTPRGAVSIGYLLSQPRIVIDRLSAGGQRITVNPDRNYAQRWPLLPLADWDAGKIPVCVIDRTGHVFIEGEIDPVIIRGQLESGHLDGHEDELIG